MQIRPMVAHALPVGGATIVQEPVYAFFHPNKLRPLEREMAIAHWSFNGFYQEMDEVTVVPPDYRIGIFDSEEAQIEGAWDDELRVAVENELCDLSERFDDILVVRSSVPPPWPRYDEFRGTPGALVRRLVEDGHDLDAVLTYERDHQNRPKIVEEIKRAISDGVIEFEPEEEEILG